MQAHFAAHAGHPLIAKLNLNDDRDFQRFIGFRADSYKVVFSPLVAFSDTAHRGESPEFRESLMFVGAPHVFGKGVLAEAEVARMIFTEIDHNFVNPVSDRHRKAIDDALGDVAYWNDTKVSGGYTDAYGTFNEYMTWSVFTL